MTYDNTNSGALFKNDKGDNEKWPDYKGKINVNGEDFWLSAWLKEGKSGKFFSLSVKPMEAKAQGKATKRAVDDMEDSIPF